MPPEWNLFVKIATITKGELAPMATFGINFISLVQKYGVGGWCDVCDISNHLFDCV